MGFISASGIASAARTRGWASFARAAAALGCLASLGGMMPLATLEVSFTGLRSAKGVLQVCIASAPGEFPDCRKGSGSIKRTVSAADPRLKLEGLAPGSYAIAVIHDANGNAKLDTALGIPREGFGFSRNPTITFGPPRFSAAEFPLHSGSGTQQVRMRYML